MGIFVYLAVALTLLPSLGMLGLVLANAVQNTSHALVLLWLLNRLVKGVVDREMAGFLVRVVAAAAVMGVACQGVLSVAQPLANSGPLVALLVASATALGAVVYVAVALVLRVGEVRELGALLLSRLRR